MRFRLHIMAASMICAAATAPASAAPGWSDYGTIGEFNQQGSVTPGNEMLFLQIAPTSNPSGCSTANSYYLPVATDLQKRLFTILLTAKASSKRVRVWVTGNCHLWGYAEIQGVVIE
jgi:hypothetical protein